jgi:hypothetical protein
VPRLSCHVDTEEIAERLGCVPRSVEGRPRVIREIWHNDDMKDL